MTPSIRTSLVRAALIPMAAAAFLVTSATPAAAGHDDDDHRRGHGWGQVGHRGHHDGYARAYRGHKPPKHSKRGHWKHHGDYCPPRYVERHVYSVAPRTPYYCRPCGHGFGSRNSFFGHVHHQHGVPFPFIPGVLVNVGVSWVFGG